MDRQMVSAIITTHNRKGLVKKAINSCLKQTYQNIECIVVDDASTDGTQDALRKYIDSGKIKYYYIPKEESKGGNYARNYGIKMSKGEYLAFLDDDDEWLLEKIKKQVEAMQEDPDVGFVYCGRINERNLKKRTRKGLDICSEKYVDGDISKDVLLHTIANTSCIMVKRSIIEQVGLFDEKLAFWQEYELSIRILQITKAKCVRENLIIYRILENDKSRLTNKVVGWEKAVLYIESKHRNLFSRLSPYENRMRLVRSLVEGIGRARSERNIKYLMKYSLMLLLHPNRMIIVIKKVLNRGKRWNV